MLDPKTALIFLLSVSTINGLTALLLWKVHKGLNGLGILATSYLLTILTFATLIDRSVQGIVLHNVLAVAAEATMAEGALAFMGRRANYRLILGVSALTAVLWEIMLAVAPDNLKLRIVAITIISVLIFGRGVVLMRMRKRRLDVAEIMVFGALSIHIVALITRMLVTVLHPDPNYGWSPEVMSWFFLELTLICVTLFFSILLMVGTRLARDLRQQGITLATERRMKSELRQFLHMLGHELRTPLSIMDRAIDTIGAMLTPPPAEVSRQLSTLRGTVERVERLTQNLLTAERADMAVAKPETLNVAEVVAEAVDMLTDKWGHGRLRTDMPAAPAQVIGDRELLFTAVINLLDNALKYSAPDTVATAALRLDQGEVVLRIRDRGIGFPRDQLAQVGQRFFRADNAREQPGTGLGLYMAKTIAQRHGGRLELANGSDGGAEVALILPQA